MKSISSVASIGFFTCLLTVVEAEQTELVSRHASLRRALRQNPELQSEKESVAISRAQVRRELLEFDWGVEALARYEDRTKPQNTREYVAVGGVQIPGSSERLFLDENLTARFGLKKKYSTGTIFEVGTRYSRLVNTLNQTSSSALYTPEYESFTGITITQPLLRGFGMDANMAGVNIAHRRVAAQEVLTRVKAMNLAAEVASRYSDIVAADRVLKVHQKNIALANQMLKRNRELLKSNEGLETDVVTAELAVYQRQDQYIAAAADKIERVNALFGLIDRGPDLEGNTRFEPSAGFCSTKNLGTKRQLIEYGRTRRLDIAYYKHVVETAKLNVLRANDSTKAQLNLTGTVGLYGLADNSNDSYKEAFDRQGTEWSIGLDFKMPLGRDGVTAAVDAAKAQKRQAELELSKAQRMISLEVDTAFSRVDSAKQRIVTSRKAVDLAKKRLQQEQDLFDEGQGDFYRVVEQQQILNDAEVTLVHSEAALSKSVIMVWLASGQIFTRLGISLEEVEVALALANGTGKQGESPTETK
ncbi:TolC family protein [Verrucomicrobiaceae bacterium N1E253]|uniref:TolC family protein n=1 Tax=Oceaniferula marina TaxID=2748318 RepID=A0A851GG46_9BACT|nr:TolC family protein [Oceaniferula marina]NWK55882.1 TolC family protein [Oceaniferula marina]